jgi:hypothetical protein
MDCYRWLLSSFFEVLVRRWSSRILERTSLPSPVLEERRETDFLSTRRILIEVCFFFSGPGILERETERERDKERERDGERRRRRRISNAEQRSRKQDRFMEDKQRGGRDECLER